MTDGEARLNIGWTRLGDTKSFSVKRSTGAEDDIATVIIESRRLAASGVAYVGEASAESVVRRIVSRLFTGLVNRVTFDEDLATIELIGSKREFQEVTMGGLVHGEGNSAQELIFCILRINGWPAARTSMHEWSPGPTEQFLVAAPISGASAQVSHKFGDVDIVLTNPCLVTLTGSDIWERFSTSESWAVTTVSADTLYDAEVEGLAKIDIGLSAIRALGAYRYPLLNGKLFSFERDRARAKVRVSDLVLVQSLSSKRNWIRSVSSGEKLDLLEIDSLEINEIEPERLEARGPMFTRSLREWKTAADSSDDSDRVAHLWRSIECYASTGAVPELFSKEELKGIRNAAKSVNAWNQDQLGAINSRMGSINNLSLNEKFRLTLSQHSINLSEKEIDAIYETRNLRNELEHGRALSEPGHRSLDIAIAVMNYVLVSVMLPAS